MEPADNIKRSHYHQNKGQNSKFVFEHKRDNTPSSSDLEDEKEYKGKYLSLFLSYLTV